LSFKEERSKQKRSYRRFEEEKVSGSNQEAQFDWRGSKKFPEKRKKEGEQVCVGARIDFQFQ